MNVKSLNTIIILCTKRDRKEKFERSRPSKQQKISCNTRIVDIILILRVSLYNLSNAIL